MFFLKDAHIAAPTPGTKVIKKEAYGLMTQANDILEQARQKASKIIVQANEIYEAKKDQGYEDGLEEGRIAHAEKLMDAAMQAVDYLETLEKSVAGLVIQCLEKVVGEMDDQNLILRIVRSGLAVTRNENRVTVRVCEAELAWVRNAISSLLQSHPGISALDIVADSRLQKGACLIESELGVVDASIDTQLEALRRAIAKRI